MAKRKVEEINSGSMADVAFLLLIFFLVTTTMEVDAGISRNLPIKRDQIVQQDVIVHDRDILVIMANSKDELLVEGEYTLIEDLEEKVKHYYSANRNGETDPKMPLYTQVTGGICQQKIDELTKILETVDPSQKMVYEDEKKKWEKRMTTCKEIGSYQEISKSAIIQLKNQSNTSYGLYIQIQDILKKVVNDLRAEECVSRGWGEYSELDPDNTEDSKKLDMLEVLVPERIIEAKIEI